MNFLQNLLVRGDPPEGSEAGAEQSAEAQPQLSQDELRKRRLARLQTPSGSPETTPASQGTPDPVSAHVATSAPMLSSDTKLSPSPTKGNTGGNASSAKLQSPKKMEMEKSTVVAQAPSSVAASNTVKRDAVNDALVQLLRVSLAPSVAKGVTYLPMVASEVGSTSLNESTLDSALYGRLYTDVNDLDPRPAESPLRYILACMERLPAVRRNNRADENPQIGAAIEAARKLLVSFAVTYLTEPSLFPTNCLAKSSTGLCTPEQEVIDLLRKPETSANSVHLLQTIFPEVLSQGVGKQIVRPILQKLSDDQKLQKEENFEYVLSQLCCARVEKLGGWGQFIAEIIADERASMDFTKTKSFFEPFSHGRRFETESIMAPFFSAPQITLEKGVVPTRAVVEAKRKHFISRLALLKQAVLDICRANEQSRNDMLSYLELALELNAERSKDRPNPHKTSSEPFANNLCAVLLHLCEPFLAKDKAMTTLPILINETLGCIETSPAFPKDATTLGKALNEETEEQPQNKVHHAQSDSEKATKKKRVKFQARAFALTLRAIDLGPIVTYRHLGLLHRQIRFVREDEGENGERFKQLMNIITTYVAFGFESTYVNNLLSFAWLSSQWFACMQLGLSGDGSLWNERGDQSIPTSAWTSGLNPKLRSLPEFILSDIPEIFVQVGQNIPDELDVQGLEKLRGALEFFIFIINAGDTIVHSPHIRANMGDAIFYSFLPDEAKQQRTNQAMWSKRGPKELALDTSVIAQTHLVPALMRLYGDVQVTGYYQVAAHRQLITKVLGYVWTIETHRPAFRSFAETSLRPEAAGQAPEDSPFVKLANGILNQTNSNVAESLAKLREIRQTQQDMKDAQKWAALPEDIRTQRTVLLESNEKEVSACLMMANDATDMLSYLSTDATFVRAFTIPALRTRLVDMLCNILASLGSRKATEFKIDNPEKYNFYPKKMLEDVFQTLLNCAKVVQGREEDSKIFVSTVAKSAYYDHDTFTNAAKLIRKHGIVSDTESLDLFSKFVEDVKAAKELAEEEEGMLGDIPDDFLDPLMSTLMVDPVILPGSKMTVDRSTIMNHLLQNKNDPFDRSPLDPSMLKEDVELKQKIQQWKTSKIKG